MAEMTPMMKQYLEIKKEYQDIRKSLWKEMFWSQSFCLISTGGATADVIRQYIQTQGDRHDRQR